MKYIYLLIALAASSAPQVSRRACDHAAPPSGMHYVCVPGDSCNCHLEKDETEAAEGVADSRESRSPCDTGGVQYFVAPSYPDEARQMKKQGIVQAQVLVGQSGVASVKIESGDPALSPSVTDALKQWQFAPSNPERIYAVSIQFRLAGNASPDRAASVSGRSPLELLITAHPSDR